MRTLLVALVGLVVAGGSAADADDAVCVDHNCVLNNGSAPPNPANIFDDDTHASASNFVYVRNADCPPGWPGGSASDPCPLPGAATEAAVVEGGRLGYLIALDSSAIVVEGGEVANALRAYDSSKVVQTGGLLSELSAHDSSSVVVANNLSTSYLLAYDSSTVTVNGPARVAVLHASDSSAVTVTGRAEVGQVWASESATIMMTGGAPVYMLIARDASTITMAGRDFKVDSVPVAYGDLTAVSGTLTGTLASGDPIDSSFLQGDAASAFSGTITLVPPSLNTPTLSPWFQLALMAGLLGAGLGVGGRRLHTHRAGTK